jgi:deoxyribonuclease V
MDIDLYLECGNIANQVPEGMVTTYGAIARALGDIRARRAVGVIMNTYDGKRTPMPCHRVVYHDGTLGGFAYGLEAKVKRLKPEGVKVKEGRIVGFKEINFTDFKVRSPKPLERAREEQLRLAKKVEVKDARSIPQLVLGLDVSYAGIDAFGAGVLYDMNKNEPVKTITTKAEVRFPYVPTYLGFKEMPIFSKIITKVKEPVVLMLDGNGTLHPFGLGIASHIGVELKMPTIGVAKNLLCGEVKGEPTKKGCSEVVKLDGIIIGHALRTSVRAKPVFVSAGHLISQRTALAITKKVSRLKLPEPVRLAHIEATKFRKESS